MEGPNFIYTPNGSIMSYADMRINLNLSKRGSAAGIINLISEIESGKYKPTTPLTAEQKNDLYGYAASEIKRYGDPSLVPQEWNQYLQPATQPVAPVVPTPAPTPTPLAVKTETPVAAPENIPLSKSGQYYKVGTDVYETATNKHIDLATFKSLGLNFEFIPEKPAVPPNIPTPTTPTSTPTPTPTPTPAPIPTPAPAQIVQENIPLSKSGEYYKVGTDVFKAATNEKIDLPTFKSLGLNFEFIPEKPATVPGTPTTPPATTPTIAPGAVSPPSPTPVPTQPPSPAPLSNIPTDYYKIPTSTGFDIYNKATGKKMEEKELFPTEGSGPNVEQIPIASELETVKSLASTGASWEDIQKYVASQKPAKTEEEITKEVYEKYGIDAKQKDWATQPTKSFEDIYKEIYTSSGLADTKINIDKITEDINQTDRDYNTAVGDINENPWISEAGRVGKVEKATQSYERTKGRLQNQLTLLNNQFERGKTEAENVATRTLNAFAQQKEWKKEELDYYLKRAEADIEAEQKLAVETETKETWRYFPEYAKSMPKEEKAVKTQVVSAGNKQLLINSETGETIRELGAVSYAPKTTKEEKIETYLTDTNYRELLTRGVPNNVADAVMMSLSEGLPLEQIRQGLAKVYGQDQGYKYLDTIIPYLQDLEKTKSAGTFKLVPTGTE